MKVIDIFNEHIERIRIRERSEWLTQCDIKKDIVKDYTTFDENVGIIHGDDVIKDMIICKAEIEEKISDYFKNLTFECTELYRRESLYSSDGTTLFGITVFYENEESDDAYFARLREEFEKYWSEKMNAYVNVYTENNDYIILCIDDMYDADLHGETYNFKLYYNESLNNIHNIVKRLNGKPNSKEKIDYIRALTLNNILGD